MASAHTAGRRASAICRSCSCMRRRLRRLCLPPLLPVPVPHHGKDLVEVFRLFIFRQFVERMKANVKTCCAKRAFPRCPLVSAIKRKRQSAPEKLFCAPPPVFHFRCFCDKSLSLLWPVLRLKEAIDTPLLAPLRFPCSSRIGCSTQPWGSVFLVLVLLRSSLHKFDSRMGAVDTVLRWRGPLGRSSRAALLTRRAVG